MATEHRGLIAAAVMIVGDPGRAEELVQDAFERTYERWDEVAPLERPGAWVRRVVINAAISATRRRGSERRALRRLMSRRRDHQQPPSEPADAALWAAVGSLPENQSRAVALHYGADLALAEVATEMELSTSAVKTLLHRARATLRDDPRVARCLTEDEVVPPSGRCGPEADRPEADERDGDRGRGDRDDDGNERDRVHDNEGEDG